MKKKFVSILILILVFVLCNGCSEEVSPFTEQENEHKAPRKFKVYVCGAVLHEGYVEVEEGTDYATVIDLAGFIPQTVLPTDPHRLIVEEGVSLSLQYNDENGHHNCININGGYIQYRLPVEGIDEDVINRIADYYELNGKITDKELLKEILGEDYQENYYKFYVDVKDYEKVS